MRDDYSFNPCFFLPSFPSPFLSSSPQLAANFFPGNACRLVVVPGQQPMILPELSVGQMAGRF
jgi:hypothetical protein